jgi:DNA-binding NtrC family response regulator
VANEPKDTYFPHLSVLEFKHERGPAPTEDQWLAGGSEHTVALRQRAAAVARRGFVAVAITGEPGVGKRRLAQWVHRNSRRADRPIAILDATADDFVAQLDMIASGFAAGPSASPGNVAVSRFARASAQGAQKLVDLLSVQGLELRCGLCLLCETPIAQARCSSPAHSQLFGRVATTLEVRPLRERKADIAALARARVAISARRFARRVRGLASGAMQVLCGYDYPGNVRELGALIDQAVLRAEGDWITEADLAGTGLQPRPDASPGEVVIRLPGSSLRDIEHQAIRVALHLTNGRLGRAADLLGITRHALRRKLDKYGLAELRDVARDSNRDHHDDHDDRDDHDDHYI